MESMWQLDLCTLEDRMRQLLERDCFKDVSFQVGEESKLFHANKAILSVASPVFAKMFYGSLAENTDQPIKILEVAPNIFSQMLLYIYTDTLKLETIPDAFEVYAAAKRYMLEPLEKKCIAHLKHDLDASNAPKIYELAEFFEEQELEKMALEIIKKQTISVIYSDAFADIKLSTLNKILEQSELQATEFQLFRALENLAISKGVINNNNDDENHPELEAFREVAKKIHFNFMTSEQFSLGPALSKLILPADAVAINAYLFSPSLMKVRYPKDFVQNERQSKNLPIVFFDITDEDSSIGQLVIQLRSDVVPTTVKDFLNACDSENPDGFKGRQMIFAESGICKVGSSKRNGTKAENKILRNEGPGAVALLYNAIKKALVFGDTFLISFDNSYNSPHNVFIGQVVEGFDLLEKIKIFFTKTDVIERKLSIDNCGKLAVDWLQE